MSHAVQKLKNHRLHHYSLLLLLLVVLLLLLEPGGLPRRFSPKVTTSRVATGGKDRRGIFLSIASLKLIFNTNLRSTITYKIFASLLFDYLTHEIRLLPNLKGITFQQCMIITCTLRETRRKQQEDYVLKSRLIGKKIMALRWLIQSEQDKIVNLIVRSQLSLFLNL